MSINATHDIGEYDVLYGRGGTTNKNKGNIFFRNIILIHQPQYKQSRRIFKPRIAEMIVEIIRNRGGRFLKYDASSDKLVDVGDEMAVTKTLQALRDIVPNTDGSKLLARGRRKIPKDSRETGLLGEQTPTLHPNLYTTPYSQATRIIDPSDGEGTRVAYLNIGEGTRAIHSNVGENSNNIASSINAQACETTNALYPDSGRSVIYSREYDTRSLPPPNGYQPRLLPTTSCLMDPSTRSLPMNHQPIFDARSHNIRHVGFQQQKLPNLQQHQQQNPDQPIPNINFMTQRPMHLHNQASIAIPTGYHERLSTNQNQRHSSYFHPPPSTVQTAARSYPHGGDIDSSRNTIQIPPQRIRQPHPVYPNYDHYESLSIRRSSLYPSSQYADTGVNPPPADFQTKEMNDPPKSSFIPVNRSYLTGIHKGNYHHKDNYQNFLSYNPNANSAATQPIYSYSQVQQQLPTSQEQDRYNLDMTRLAFLPPQESSSATNNVKAEDSHKQELHSAPNTGSLHTAPGTGLLHSAPDTSSNPSFDEKYIPV